MGVQRFEILLTLTITVAQLTFIVVRKGDCESSIAWQRII